MKIIFIVKVLKHEILHFVTIQFILWLMRFIFVSFSQSVFPEVVEVSEGLKS